MARLLPHTVTIASRQITLWGDTEKLTEFFPDLVADAADDGELRTVAVAASSYRKYPGGPLINRRAHNRTFDTNRGIPNLAKPGRRFWIEPPDFTILGIPQEVNPNQFSFQGAWFALKAYAFQELPAGFVIRSTGGRAFLIPEPEEN